MTDCIEAPGGRTTDGYAQVRRDGRQVYAHRVAWEEANGPIPDGMCICHHCDNRGCINPEHLFLGTKGDNNRDMVGKGRHRSYWRERTACSHGHEYTEENTRITPQGWRDCRTCVRLKMRRRRAA